MKYEQPTIATIGQSERVVQSSGKAVQQCRDGSATATSRHGAYEIDE
jgi:hypothetical protein